MRGGMWNGRASRRTQGSIVKQGSKASAGIGTTVEHPSRKRIDNPQRVGTSKTSRLHNSRFSDKTGCHSGPPRHINPRKQPPDLPRTTPQPLQRSNTPELPNILTSSPCVWSVEAVFFSLRPVPKCFGCGLKLRLLAVFYIQDSVHPLSESTFFEDQ